MYMFYNSNFNFKTNTKYLASTNIINMGYNTMNENNKNVFYEM